MTNYHTFHGLDVVDAEVPTMIPLLQVDIDNAEAMRSAGVNDPTRFAECVVGQSCERSYGSGGRVRITRMFAYVAWENATHAIRYELSSEAREIVRRFDAGELITAGVQIVLLPPSAGNKLKAMRERNARRPRKGGKTKTNRGLRTQTTSELRNGVFARA